VNRDLFELLAALRTQGVRLMVIGAHTLAAHGIPLAAGDLDVLSLLDLGPDRSLSPISGAFAHK
jgi:hypothetical protein